MNDGADRVRRLFLVALASLALVTIGAICWHSVEEIHYLKSFFPRNFTVEEAFYAGALELIKVVIITVPLALLIAVCLYLLRVRRDDP